MVNESYLEDERENSAYSRSFTDNSSDSSIIMGSVKENADYDNEDSERTEEEDLNSEREGMDSEHTGADSEDEPMCLEYGKGASGRCSRMSDREDYSSQGSGEFVDNPRSLDDHGDEEDSLGHNTPSHKCSRDKSNDTSLSLESRLTLLEEEKRLMLLQNEVLLSRERSLYEKLESLEEDYGAQCTNLLQAERKVARMKKELELQRCKFEARNKTLENHYRDLCDKVAANEDNCYKMRLEMQKMKLQNTILEEILENRDMLVEQLERRLNSIKVDFYELRDKTPEHTSDSLKPRNKQKKQPRDSPCVNDGSLKQVKILKDKLEASQKQMKTVLSELAHYVARSVDAPSDSLPGKYDDYSALIVDYNLISEKLAELEAEHNLCSTRASKLNELEAQVNFLTSELAEKTRSSKKAEKALVVLYTERVDDLKDKNSDLETELQHTKALYKDLERTLGMVKNENTELKNSLFARVESVEDLKSQKDELTLENEDLSKKVQKYSLELQTLKSEHREVLERERTNAVIFNEYIKRADDKISKLEVLQTQCNKPAVDGADTPLDFANASPNSLKAILEDLSSIKSLLSSDARPLGSGKESDYKSKMSTLEAENKRIVENYSSIQNVLEPTDGIHDKYNKLKEAFKTIVTDFLKREKVLIDSLKNTVKECHSNKKRVKELETKISGEGCKCSEYFVDGRKSKSCYCRFKHSSRLRDAIIKRARTCESAAIAKLMLKVEMYDCGLSKRFTVESSGVPTRRTTRSQANRQV